MPKTTCKPGRRSAYSEDLRWRIVWQREVLGYKYGQVASNLNVDVSTVWRVVKLSQETGKVDKKAYQTHRAFGKLTTPLQLTVLHLVLEHPGIYLREIHTELFELTGADISYSQICRPLNYVGFSRQKIKYAALQRDQRLIKQMFLYTTKTC
jgi:transposase